MVDAVFLMMFGGRGDRARWVSDTASYAVLDYHHALSSSNHTVSDRIDDLVCYCTVLLSIIHLMGV